VLRYFYLILRQLFILLIKLIIMKRIYLLAIILIIAINTDVFGQANLDGWSYSTPITVTNPNATPLTDFQILLSVNTASMVGAGHMLANGNDIRFIEDANCTEFLPYYIDSGMNSTATKIWVKIPSIPASGSVDIYLFYGNPAATIASSANLVFDLWENFDGPTYRFALNGCSSGASETPAAGQMTYSWTSNGIWVSDSIFPLSTVYTAEANVTAASGNWPGLIWAKSTGITSYGLLMGSAQVRISYGVAGSFCSGHNWANTPVAYTDVVGLWSLTWVATGDQRAIFPSVGPMTATDVNNPKDTPLNLCVGGISSGTGSMTFDWIRIRKWADITPTSTFGTQSSFSAVLPGFLGTDEAICDGDSITLSTAPLVFVSYDWSTTETTPDIVVDASGSYIVTVTDGFGCDYSDSVDLTVNALPIVTLAAFANVCEDDVPFALTGGLPSGGTYSGVGVSGGNFNPATATVGTHVIYYNYMDVNGCVNLDSSIITVDNCIGVNEFPDVNTIRVFPNPNNGQFSIELPANEDCLLNVFNSLGQLVYDTRIVGKGTVNADLGNLPSGVYQMRFDLNNQSVFMKLVIK
jgi:hypothetical protein